MNDGRKEGARRYRVVTNPTGHYIGMDLERDGKWILAEEAEVRLAEVERERDRLRKVVRRFESHLLDGDGHLKAHRGCANNRGELCNCPDFNRHPTPTQEPTE